MTEKQKQCLKLVNGLSQENIITAEQYYDLVEFIVGGEPCKETQFIPYPAPMNPQPIQPYYKLWNPYEVTCTTNCLKTTLE